MTKIKGTENVPSKPAPKPRKTGRPCTVCRLDALKEIDAALLRGEGFVDLARRYAVSQDAVERHYARHMPLPFAREALRPLLKLRARGVAPYWTTLVAYVTRSP
jgi:hypothetical protein